MQRSKLVLGFVWSLFVVVVPSVQASSGEELRRRGMMGVMLGPVSQETVGQLKLDGPKGVLVTSVVPESAAAAAGVQSNDVIRKIGPDAIDDLPALFGVMRKYFGGDAIKLTVIREGAETTLELTLKPRPKEAPTDFEIVYDSAGEAGKRVRTLVTRPKGAVKAPAILFINGFEQRQSMELAFPNPHPIKSLIQEFNKAGYVTMRVDRLGVGDSEGVDVQATSVTDDVASFRSALSKLRTYDFVDPDRVFIFGHSLGTTIVPVVAKDQKLAGVISFASVYRPWPETILESMQQRWKLELLPEDQIKKRTDSVKAFLDQFVTKKQPLDSVLEGNAEYREIFGEGALDRGFIGMPAKYAQDLATLPSASAWGAVNAPVLAIWGEADYIAARGDGEKLAETVNKAHAGKGCFLKLPEVDHMMSKAADQEESFLAGQGTFNPKFIEAVLKWMTDKGC